MAIVCALYRNEVHTGSHMVQLEQPEIQEQIFRISYEPQENEFFRSI